MRSLYHNHILVYHTCVQGLGSQLITTSQVQYRRMIQPTTTMNSATIVDEAMGTMGRAAKLKADYPSLSWNR